MTDTMILKIEPMLISYDEARAALDEVEAEWNFKLDDWQATLVIKAVRRGFSNPFDVVMSLLRPRERARQRSV